MEQPGASPPMSSDGLHVRKSRNGREQTRALRASSQPQGGARWGKFILGAVAALPGAGHGAAACTGSVPARVGAVLVAGSKSVRNVGKGRKCGLSLFSTNIMHGE